MIDEQPTDNWQDPSDFRSRESDFPVQGGRMLLGIQPEEWPSPSGDDPSADPAWGANPTIPSCWLIDDDDLGDGDLIEDDEDDPDEDEDSDDDFPDDDEEEEDDFL